MIINNTVSEIGDVLIFGPSDAVNGINNIIDFTDNIVGTTSQRYFTKYFRYTLDGINWGEWITLNATTLNSIQINSTLDFNVEYMYVRSGSDSTGILTWNWINLNTEKASVDCGEVFHSSVFSYFFSCCCDQDNLRWCLNVLRKMYRPGIVMKSMERGVDNNLGDQDRDYIDFWRSITCYFSLFVNYARKFEQFDQNAQLLSSYLIQRGLYVRDNESIEALSGLMTNYYRIVSSRGTSSIFSTNIQSEGEIIKLIDRKIGLDEFLVDISDSEGGNGWLLNKHSPLYRGTSGHKSLNKIKELSGENYFRLILKAKGVGNTLSNIQPGDVIEGFKTSDVYWTSAIYLGGNVFSRDNYLPIEQSSYGEQSLLFNTFAVDRIFPIPYNSLNIKTKGRNNSLLSLQIGDVVEGFKDNTIYWTSAIYLGGDSSNRSNYYPLEQTTLPTTIPSSINFMREWATLPIPFNKLLLKAKALGNVLNDRVQIGDIVEGFSADDVYWTSAIYLGGDSSNRSNYYPLETSSFVIDSPGTGTGDLGGVIPIIPGSQVTLADENGDMVIIIDSSRDQITGIGGLISQQSSIIVDSQLHYEISFLAKVSDINIPLIVKLYGLDAVGQIVNPTIIDINNSSNIALNNIKLPKANTYYSIKVSIFPFTQSYDPTQEVLRTSLGVGDNLKMAESISSVIPEIAVNGPLSDEQGNLTIKNLAFQLCTTPYNKGFIGAGSLIELWMKNNSMQNSNSEVSQILRQYIIPYKLGMINNFL